MRPDFHQDDPKAVWQEQRREESTMNVVLIRQKARQLRSRKVRQVFGTVLAPIVVAFFYGFCLEHFPSIHSLLHALFVFSLAWSVAGIFFLNRGMPSGVVPEGAGFSTGLEFCRREMERQLSCLKGALLWSFSPIVVAVGLLVLILATRTSIFPRGIPLVTLVVVWIAAYLIIRARQRRDLERELHELTAIERDNS